MTSPVPPLQERVLLSKHTSVRVGGPADLFTVAKGNEALELAVRWALSEGLPFLVLGSGSNVVIADAGFRGLVIKSISRGVRVLDVEADTVDEHPASTNGRGVVIELDSGTFLPTAAKILADQGLAGIEWGVGIPGTAGGAVVGNAGAYGGVTNETLLDVDGLSAAGEPITLTLEELTFEYRSSSIKRGEREMPVVLRVRHVLRREEPGPITSRIRTFLAERKRKQPVEPSVGSTFKNPEGTYAGAVIEAAGLKGLAVGGAMISPKHANYVTNTGTATAAEVRTLVELVREAVLERCGIELETEIEFKGEW